MAVTTVITDLPPPPHRGVDDQTTFVNKGEALFDALYLSTVSEMNSAFDEINATEINITNLEASAESFALTAINAPATQSTSTTSLTIGTGTKSLTIQADKSLVVGMSLKIASTSSPTNWMVGDITSYTSGTGALSVSVSGIQGTGTFSNWTVSLASTVASLNSFTADSLSTPRLINGVSFDGTSDISIEDRMATAIACSATTNIGTAGIGDTIHLTGTTTITSFGVSTTGTRRILIMDGTGTITHNSTSLICPASTSITKIAGMSLQVICENGSLGYWRVLSVTDPNISSAEQGYLNGVTSSIQTQIDNKFTTPSSETSYTPVITGSVSNGTFTYGTQVGRYVAIGNIRVVYFQVTWTAATIGSGDIRLSLPVSVDASAYCRGSVSIEGITITDGFVVARASTGQAYITLDNTHLSSANTQLQHSAIASTGSIVGTLTYFT